MTAQGVLTSTFQQLQLARNGMLLPQGLCAAVRLGVADLIERGEGSTAELARALKVKEDMLFRLLRALAGEGVFEDYSPRTFRNSQLPALCVGMVPGRSIPSYLLWGTEFYYRSLGRSFIASRTGDPAIGKVLGMREWEYMRENQRERESSMTR